MPNGDTELPEEAPEPNTPRVINGSHAEAIDAWLANARAAPPPLLSQRLGAGPLARWEASPADRAALQRVFGVHADRAWGLGAATVQQ